MGLLLKVQQQALIETQHKPEQQLILAGKVFVHRALADVSRLGYLLAESTGYRLLGFWDNGFRHLSTSQRPIAEPGDCAGMTIRTLFSDLHQKVFAALGFEPVALDVKDLLEGVRSGRIVAQENPLTNTYNFEIFRHHRYITLSAHFFGAAARAAKCATVPPFEPELAIRG